MQIKQCVGESTNDESTHWSLVVHGGATNRQEIGDAVAQQYHDGLRVAVDAGRGVLFSGRSALDAVQSAVSILEDNPLFNAGRGSVIRLDGGFELDACLMDGSDGRSGAVAGVKRLANPIAAARLVLEDGRYRMLAGPGADQFAIENGCVAVEHEYFFDHRSKEHSKRPSLGTVGAVAMDRDGNLAAATSTGGITRCLPGRIGDTPIVGAGTYAENGSVAISTTGFGERFLRHSAAAQVAWMMQHLSLSIDEAIDNVLHKVLPPQSGGMIGVGSNGEIVVQTTTKFIRCGWATSHGESETALQVL